ncbi:MAG: hypothetical protein ACREX9_15940 [Gammaproteobacteria bacterium]
MREAPFESETTPVGEQALVPGVKPLTQRERLQAVMRGPLLPKRPQKPCNLGLFDTDARNQLDLFINVSTKGNPS